MIPQSAKYRNKLIPVISSVFLQLADDYQELTPREEKDLEKMLSQFEHALANVEEFTGQLSKELQQLEYVSI